MKYYIFASGSHGNATLITSKNTRILIDIGISKKRLCEELKKINLSFSDIDALFITHEHNDHIQGLKYFLPNKIYSMSDVFESTKYNYMDFGECYEIKDILVIPFPVVHDAKKPAGFKILCDDEKLTYITDTGLIDDKSLSLIGNSTYYILESNHDLQMLKNSTYPYKTKLRISSYLGHLSNSKCGDYLSTLIGENTKEITLAHLSQNNNHPILAIRTVTNILLSNHLDLSNIKIQCAYQDRTICGGHED